MMVDALVILVYANIAGELLVCGRLAQLRLIRRYKWFALWMAFSAVQELSLLFTSSSYLFVTLWQITEIVMLGLEVLVALEVYELITSTQHRIKPFGSTSLKTAVFIGVVVSFVFMMSEWRGAMAPWIFPVKRMVTLVLAVALMCLSFAFRWVTRPIRPNVVRHCRILTVYLSSVAGWYFFVYPGWRVLSSGLVMALWLGCLVAWIVFIRRDGENVPTLGGSPNSALMNRD
jgi:hypothetical protein